MARRYGRLPTDLLSMTIQEYSINEMVMRIGAEYESSQVKGKPMILSDGRGDRAEVANKLINFFDARRGMGKGIGSASKAKRRN